MTGAIPIAVFGSSEPVPGEPLYEQARELGALLAGAGYSVVSGGYGGVMEAASRGARERDGEALGVTCDIFSHRAANRYLTRSIPTRDLYQRQRELIERSRAYVVLQGRAGTLSELALLWALHRAGCLGRRPVVLLGVYWGELLQLLTGNGSLEQTQLDVTRLVSSPQEALRVLQELVDRSGGL